MKMRSWTLKNQQRDVNTESRWTAIVATKVVSIDGVYKLKATTSRLLLD